MRSAPADKPLEHGAGACAVHRKRERVATCGACGNDLCVDCVVHTPVGIKCRSCTGGAAATTPTASREAKAARLADDAGAPVGDGAGRSGRRWPVPVAIVGALAIAAAGFALLAGDGEQTSGARSGGDTEGNTPAVVERVGDFKGAGGLNIGATLKVPAGVGAKKAPGVLIVPGGATLDRTGLSTRDGQSDPLYDDLANAFAEAGIVSLRYDMRGTGASKVPEGQTRSFEDLVVDAKSGLDFLAARRETQGAPLAVLGYDSGGFVALSLAAADSRIKGVVLVSTPGRPLVEVLAEDFIREVPDQGPALAEGVRAAAAQVVSTGQVPPADTLPPALRGIFLPSQGAYLRGLFGFDPVAEATRVQVPTLVVRGASDTSITDVDVAQLTSNLARGDRLVLPVVGNSLALPAGQEGPLHNPTRHGSTRDPEALEDISEWLTSRLRPS